MYICIHMSMYICIHMSRTTLAFHDAHKYSSQQQQASSTKGQASAGAELSTRRETLSALWKGQGLKGPDEASLRK